MSWTHFPHLRRKNRILCTVWWQCSLLAHWRVASGSGGWRQGAPGVAAQQRHDLRNATQYIYFSRWYECSLLSQRPINEVDSENSIFADHMTSLLQNHIYSWVLADKRIFHCARNFSCLDMTFSHNTVLNGQYFFEAHKLWTSALWVFLSIDHLIPYIRLNAVVVFCLTQLL